MHVPVSPPADIHQTEAASLESSHHAGTGYTVSLLIRILLIRMLDPPAPRTYPVRLRMPRPLAEAAFLRPRLLVFGRRSISIL